MPEASRRAVFSAIVDAAQDLLRLLQQIPAGLGEPDLACGALEQLDAQPVFKLEHDAADRRLRHRQALGGPVEVEFLGHRHEGRQVLEIVSQLIAISFQSYANKIISQLKA